MSEKSKLNENFQRMQFIAQKEILSFREALIYLDVSESFLYKLTSKKAIEFSKPNGGRIYFKKSDLDKWMLQNDSISTNKLEQEVMNHLKSNAR
ncbi:MAG: helix-turn-helix domain-containing protein [Flavobacteriaceae bacterium]